MQRKLSSKKLCLAVVTDKFIEIINCVVIAQNIITIPLVNNFAANLQSYFSISNITVTNGFCLVPYVLFKANNNYVNWREKVWNFFWFYNTYFVFVKNIPAEIEIWERYSNEKFEGNLPTTLSDTLDALNELNPYSYWIASEGLKIGALASTSCICEQLISSLRRLKDYTQSTIKSDIWLSIYG